MMGRAGAAATKATAVAAARAAMVATVGGSATDATVTKAATAATAAMATMEIPFAVGAVGSHSGDRQCIMAVAVVLIGGIGIVLPIMEFCSMSGGLQWGMQQGPAVIVAGGDRDGMIYEIQGGFQNLSFGSHPAYVLSSKTDHLGEKNNILEACVSKTLSS